MCEVLRSNFEEELPNVLSNIDRAAFVAIDTEFTGLQGSLAERISLFDSGEERYQLLKKTTANYIVCQIGLSAFVPVQNANSYEAYTYNFFICPLSHGVTEEFFSCQASSLEFLCEHGFDFNKFIYQGIPYVNKEREIQIKKAVKNESFLAAVDRNIDERLLQEYCSTVASWVLSANYGETMEIDVGRRISPYTLHAELRQRFPDVWTFDLGLGKIKIEKVTSEDRVEKEKTGETPGSMLLNSMLGFTKVFRHLAKANKPLVGHNMLLDLIMIYKQFHQSLPKTFRSFKRDIHELFPIIYDTKHICFELKKDLEKSGVVTTQSIQDLYQGLSSKKGCFVVLYSPHISHGKGHDRYEADRCPHEAGYDAYIAGYVFLRLAHMKALWNIKSTMMKPLTPTQHLAALRDLSNRVNIIRAQINYISLCGEDPVVQRPEWLVVESMEPNKPLNLVKVAQIMSRYGTVDLRPRNPQLAVIAIGNYRCAKDILRGFHGHPAYRISKYSLLHHSPVVRPLLWTGLVLSGGLGILLATAAYRQYTKSS